MSQSTANQSHNARWGLIFFFIYLVLYLGFMALSAFAPAVMAAPTPLGSVNVAIMYGMGLILAAIVLALLYLIMARAAD